MQSPGAAVSLHRALIAKTGLRINFLPFSPHYLLTLSRLLVHQQVQRHRWSGRARERARQGLHHQLRSSKHRPPGGPGAETSSASRHAVFLSIPRGGEQDADSRAAPQLRRLQRHGAIYCERTLQQLKDLWCQSRSVSGLS
jgi:hypothetical protein